MNANSLFWRGYTRLLGAQQRLTREGAQDFLEYIIIVGFALLVVAAVAALYGAINGKFLDAAAAIQGIHF
ncbi:MAG: hypothetical protein KKA73_03650 [Chloroflexi bacterium]|nr:hypothetical protein [Chloroflexota bacterium]